MAVAVTLTHTGTLVIDGSDQDDVVDLSRAPVGKIRVIASGEVTEFHYASVKRIRGRMHGGNDHVFAHGLIYKGMNIEGGDGNDVLHGGYGGDSLVGEDGDDYLFGGYWFDTLIGGAGRDRLDAADAAAIDPGFGGGFADFVDGDDDNSDLILHDVYDRVHTAFDTVFKGDEADFAHLRGATEVRPRPVLAS